MAGYSQNDARWAADFLGTSGYWRMGTVGGNTAAAAGCLIAAGAKVCKALGHDITPGDLNRLATANGLINSNGDVTRWDWLTVLFPDIVYVETVYWGNDPAPLSYFDIQNDLDTEIILMIDDSPAAGMQTHFMRVVGLSGQDVIVDDSWDGVRKGVSAYGARWNPPVSAKSIIYRAIKYKRGSAPAPVPPQPTQGGEEMITNVQEAHDAYYMLRGDDLVTDDEIIGTAGRRSWAEFATTAKPEVATRETYKKTLEQHAADLTAQVSDLTSAIAALSARPTTEELQALQAKATDLTVQVEAKNAQISDLQKQIDACSVPVAAPQVPTSPSTSISPWQLLLQTIKNFVQRLRR